MAPTNDRTVNNFKAVAFDWIFKALLGIVLWLVKDMHSDLQVVLQTLPAMRVEIEFLKDKRLMDKGQMYELYNPRAKHEDEITFDSLTTHK